MSGTDPSPLQASDGGDVSPKTPVPGGKPGTQTEYFPSVPPTGVTTEPERSPSPTDTSAAPPPALADIPSVTIRAPTWIGGNAAKLDKGKDRADGEVVSESAATSPSDGNTSPTLTFGEAAGFDNFGRKFSVSSLAFRAPRNPSIAQGTGGGRRLTDGGRMRAASPPARRFESHVSFDNVPVGEATKNNVASYTINDNHCGYQRNRRSRTFMVGVDENLYSDYALEWLLKELVEDGDHVVCVTVIEKEVRSVSEAYKAEAKARMENIKLKSGANRAIAITLEYAVGKLHTTFQKFIQLHQPAMLIVGTKGKSLGGFQGLVGARNSFSKYCLQYCPVPVVVVRPTDQREKKKAKRMHDEDRQSYAKMLPGGVHEADSDASSMFELEVKLPQEQEAHEVARVLGLPAAFDPTLKPINPRDLLGHRGSAPSVLPQTATDESGSTVAPASPPGALRADTPTAGDESDSSDTEGEFETFTGQQALAQSNLSNKKDKLHQMEVGEAAALLKSGPPVDDDEDD